MLERGHNGYYSRGYLPHFDEPVRLQNITFRLHDAVPSTIINDWKQELNLASSHAEETVLTALHERISNYEDTHYGECWLHQPDIAQIVEKAFHYFDGIRYRLHAWCIMPNHVHVLIETNASWPLAAILHSWKSYSAQKANRILKRTGPFWFREYHDRFIRNEKHYSEVVAYIENNPVKAGLVAYADEWHFSSLYWRKKR